MLVSESHLPADALSDNTDRPSIMAADLSCKGLSSDIPHDDRQCKLTMLEIMAPV